MAIITEQEEVPQEKSHLRKRKPSLNSPPTTKPSSSSSKKSTTTATTAENPFKFWFYFTLVVTLLTFLFTLFSSLSPQDPKSWFLNLPPNLRLHYSSGRIIKVQTSPSLPHFQLFSVQKGPTNSHAHVLFVHGLGSTSFSFRNILNYLSTKNLHAVSFDLPGSGFSDKSFVVNSVFYDNSFLGRLWEVYEEIKDKGLFWGFDQLVEQGYVDFQETRKEEARVTMREIVKTIEFGSEEMGRVLGQVVDSMGLTPVDLVLHDSAFVLSANWIVENRGLIRSVVVLDSGTAFPVWLLGVPVVREVVLGFKFVFERVMGMCCVKFVGGGDEAEAHRILLKGMDGGKGVAEMVKKINSSFDLFEWSRLDGVKGLPVKVIWSNGWSDEWTAKGVQVSDAIPQATLVEHSGGRWIQDANAEEVASSMFEFLSSLPIATKQVVKEPIPEHSQEMFDKADIHQHHHHGHGHGEYMDAYGLSHGVAM